MAASLSEQAGNLAVGVFQIAEMHAVCRAYRHTGRIQPSLDAMNTKSAFIRIPLRMNEARIIRTSCHAGFTAYAFFIMNKNDTAAFMYVTGAAGTAIDAGGIIAMIAAFAADFHERCRICSLRIIDNPVAIEALRNLILGLAGNDAIHAAYTSLYIDGHSITRHRYASPLSKVTKLTFIPVPPIKGSVA